MNVNNSRVRHISEDASKRGGQPTRAHKVGKRAGRDKKVISKGREEPQGLTDATPPPELGENLNA